MALTFDDKTNFAYSVIAVAPSPATSGTSLEVAPGTGALFPTVPFNAVIWPASVQPTTSNAEIVRVTAKATDTFTITRQQEGSNARTIGLNDQIAVNITVKTLTDIEDAFISAGQVTGPVGSIVMWPTGTAPTGWLLCDGSAVSRTTYSELFALISTTFGVGDGSTTFNLPNMVQRIPIGKATAGALATIGATDGSWDHTHGPGTLTVASHTHGPGTLTVASHVHDSGSLQVASHTHGPGTLTVASHSHGNGTLDTLPDGSHSHTGSTSSDGSHSHSVNDILVDGATSGSDVSVREATDTSTDGSHSHSFTTNSGGTHSHAVTGTIGSTAPAVNSGTTASTAPSVNAGTTGATAPAVNAGVTAGTAPAVSAGVTGSANPPVLVLNFIIRANSTI